MSAYIAGITKRLILKKCRNNKQIENIEDYSDQLVGEKNIELNYFESQKNQLILNELEKKVVDGEIDINEYNRRINTGKELIEAREQYDKIKQPVTTYDWNNTPNNQNIEKCNVC